MLVSFDFCAMWAGGACSGFSETSLSPFLYSSDKPGFGRWAQHTVAGVDPDANTMNAPALGYSLA